MVLGWCMIVVQQPSFITLQAVCTFCCRTVAMWVYGRLKCVKRQGLQRFRLYAMYLGNSEKIENSNIHIYPIHKSNPVISLVGVVPQY